MEDLRVSYFIIQFFFDLTILMLTLGSNNECPKNDKPTRMQAKKIVLEILQFLQPLHTRIKMIIIFFIH